MPRSEELGESGVQTTDLQRESHVSRRSTPKRKNVSNFERNINAIIKLIVLGSLALTFLAAALVMLYGIMFVEQPFGDQAANDKAIFAILTPLMIFLPTVLGHYIQNAEKSKDNDDAA